MQVKNHPHEDIQKLVAAAEFIIQNCLHGGEIFFQHKPGETGRLDIKTYGFTTGKTKA